MRVLTVANYLDATGGLERTQLANCRGLAEKGHELDLLYVHDGEFSPEWRAFTSTMTQVDTTLPRRARPIRSSLAATSAIHRGRRRRPDIVYVYRYWDIPFAVTVATASRASVVYHLCLPPPEQLPRWFRTFLARIDTTISVSGDTLALWRDTGLRTDRAIIALTSVDLDRYMPAPPAQRVETRCSLGIPPDDFVVFFAGRISPEKGVEVLIDAFRELVAMEERCHLVILGSPTAGTDPRAASTYTERLHFSAEGLPVTWLPRRPDVVPLLQAADVAVVPSLWPEPLSRSILEPLACGVPVVASRVGGSPEVLTGWLSDFLVTPADPLALASRLVSLRNWRSQDAVLGDRCRQFAEDHLSPDKEFDLIEATMLDAVRAQRR